MDRTSVIERMYEGYLAAHERLVAGAVPSDIPELAGFSARLDHDSVFRFPSLGLELRGRESVERFLVEVRQATGLRETSERVVEHGDVVVSFNRTSFAGAEGAPVVAVFRFEGERVVDFWGFAG